MASKLGVPLVCCRAPASLEGAFPHHATGSRTRMLSLPQVLYPISYIYILYPIWIAYVCTSIYCIYIYILYIHPISYIYNLSPIYTPYIIYIPGSLCPIYYFIYMYIYLFILARRSNQSILKEISPQYSLEGLMLKLKLQYFGHLMGRADSLEKTLMLGRIEGERRRG